MCGLRMDVERYDGSNQQQQTAVLILDDSSVELGPLRSLTYVQLLIVVRQVLVP